MKYHLTTLLFILLASLNIHATSGGVCITDLRGSTSEGIPNFDYLVPCGAADTLALQINAAADANLISPSLKLALPEGMKYANFVGSNSGANITQSIVSTTNTPVFNLPNIAAGDSLILFVLVEGSCPVVDSWINLEPINITYTLNYQGGSFVYTPPLEYNTSIYIPFLNLLEIAPNYPVLNVGDTYTRQIKISQDGINAFVDDFTYESIHHGGVEMQSMQIANLSTGITQNLSFVDTDSSSIAQISTSMLNSVGLNGIFYESEELVIIETVKVLTCEPDNRLTDFEVYWGCENETCQRSMLTNGYNIGQGLPRMNIAVSDQSESTLCEENYFTYTVTNNGSEVTPGAGYARDIWVEIKTNCDDSPFLDAYNVNTFYINNVPVVPTLSTTSNGYIVNISDLGILEDIDDDGFAGEMAIGDSFSFTLTYERNCFGVECGQLNLNSCTSDLIFAVNYEDQCGNPKDPKSRTIFNVRSSPSAFAYIEGDAVITQPTQTVSYEYCYSYLFQNVTCPDAQVRLRVSTSSSDFSPLSALINHEGQTSPANIIVENDSTFYLSGGTISADDESFTDCWTFTLQFDDSRGCGPIIQENIDFQVVYSCACANCYSSRACDSYVILIDNECGVGNCTGVVTEAINVERTTFGWIDNSMTTLANANMQGIELDRAYTCDHIEVTVNGTVDQLVGIDSLSGAGARLAIYTPNNELPLEYLNATFIVNGLPLTCAIPSPTQTVTQDILGNDVIYLDFDFSNCLANNEMFLYETDQLQAIINFKVTEANGYGSDMTLTQFVGGIFGKENGQNYGCKSKIADFYIANPAVMPLSRVTQEQYGCSGEIMVDGFLEIPATGGDDFLLEYRPWFGNLNATVFGLPEGFSYIQSSGLVEAKVGDQWISFPTDPLIQANGTILRFENIEAQWPIPDKTEGGLVYRFHFELRPSCQANGNGLITYQYSIDDNYYANAFDPSCVTQMEAESSAIVLYRPPQFVLNNLTPVVQGINKEASWLIEVCNVAEYDAGFSWLAFESESGAINFTEIEEVTDTQNPINYTLSSYNNNQNVWVNMGPFDGDNCRVFKLTATYSTCEVDEIKVRMGWNCLGNFINPNLSNACPNKEVKTLLLLQPEPASMQANLLDSSGPIDLCSDAFFELEFKNVSLGTIYDIKFDIILPLQGAEFVENSFSFAYPFDAPYIPISVIPEPIDTNILGIVYRFDATEFNTILAENGLVGIPTPDDLLNRFKIRFEVKTNCDFRSGDIFRFRAFGINACGKFSNGALQGAEQIIEGAEPPYNTQLVLTADPIQPCNPEPVNFSAIAQNFGPAPIGAYDFIRVRMPQGLSYVPGTSVAVSPANWALEEPSIVEIADGFQELNWQLPPNMPVNAIAQVDFKVDATNYAESCGSQGFGIETYTFGFLGCGDIAEPGYQVCFVEILTGNSIFNLTVEKPNLQFLQNQTDIYATCSGGPFEQLNTNIALQNYGIATLPGDYLTIKYIHDANANGVYDAADALLDTYVYTDVINAGQIINIERSILVSGGQACPLLLYVDDSENCVCLPSNLFFPEVQYDNVSDDVSVCSGASIELGCVAVPGYHYTWIYNDNYGNHLSCTDCANPIFSLENNTNQPITQTYTLITQRGNLSTSCTSSQSVTITITPSNNITANAQSVCEGQSIQLNGPAGGSQYSWLPLNGFGNPYVSNPIITPPVGTTTYILSYLDAYGCDATYSITIETEPLPEPEVIVSGDLSTCAGAGEIVLDAGAGYYSYAWFDASNPTAPIPVGSNQLFAPTVSGDYYVVVVSNTANQCEGVSSPPIPVTINEYVKPTILANGETEVCGGESVTLFIAGNYTNVQWYTENNPPPAQPVHTGLSFTTSTSGNYFVTATDENGCNGSSEPIIVTVHSLQAINITVANNDTDLCTGESVVLSVPNIFDEYMWTLNGNVISAAGNTLTVSQSGTYAIKAIDLNGCEVISDPVTITVHQFTPPQISAVGSTTVCEGQSVTFAVFGNYAQIQWYNANNPPPSGIVLGTGNVFTTTVSGNYLVYVSDNNGCSGTSTPATANILPPNATLSLLTNPIQDICEGETANLQVASGFFNYTWYHNGAIVSGSLNSFVASTGGTYFVTAQTFDGCEVMSETFTITVYPIPQPGIEVDGEQQFCEGENIILTLTEPHETYQWYRNGTAIPNATNEELIVSQNGNYYAVVSDNNCPGQTFEIPITVYPLPQVSITAGTNPVCEGETVSLTSSAGNYATRQWLRNGLLIYQANQSTITVSEPGIYSLEVTDANGCSNISNDIEIEFNPTPEVAIMLGGDNTFCEGGSVTAIATAGYVSYQWFVNGVATQNGASNQITIAQTTEVSVVATDVNACQGTAVPVQIITTPLPQPQIIAPITEICAGETATLAVQGAYPFVQWYLNDQLIPTATSSIIEVSQAGNYTVYVNNLNGCEGTSAPVSISVNPLPQPQFLETEFLVCGNDQLPITLVVAGNYNYYTWYKNGVQVVAQGNTTSTYQAYDAGIYTVEVTNANGCKGITGDAAEITVVPDMPVNLTADKYEICPGEVVEFDANANAEIFAWTPNDGSLSCLTCARPVATPTQTTTYTLTITDDFGCQKTESVTIIVHPEPNVNLTITDPEICEGQISSMVATAGFQNYDFYRNGITLVQSGTNNVLVTSEAGVYTVIATNQYGCSKPSSPQSLIVHDLPTPSLNIAGNINLCEGGSVSINTEVYSAYVWYLNDNVINGANNNVVTISQSGNVYVKVTDENGCEGTSSVVYIDVNSNPQPSVLAEQTEICQGETAELAVLGGYASVQWYLNGSIIPTGTSNNYFAVQSGAYTVSVTDFEGCSATSSAINIVVNPLPQVAVVPVNTEICQEDGETVLLTATPGYSTYNWYLNGGALVQSSSSNTYNAGQSGTYTVKVINENGCEGQSNGANILLKSIPPVNAGATDTQICLGESTQLFVNSNASNISWSPVQSLNCLNCPNPVATPTQTTTYTVSITDEEGCTATDQVTVQVLNTVAPSISVLGDIAVCQGESISLQASGGYVQYTWYKENGVIVQNGASSVFTTQVGGSYYVTAIGATGCPATSNMVAISFYEQPTVSIEFLSQNTFCEGGSVMLEANNNFSNYQWYANGILLQSGANNQFEVSNSANVYVVATNSNGCVAQSSTVVVNTNPLPNPVIIAPVTEICVGETTTLAVQGVYGEIQWYRNNVAIPTGTDNNLEVSQSGAYTVYVNDLAGCEGTSPVVQIIVNPLPTPHLVETSFLVCGETDLPVVLAVQESYAYYTWYYNGVEIVGQGAALQTFEAYSTGIYSVEVTNDKGCKAMSGETVNVLVPPSLPVNLTADKYEICPGEVVEFDANANAETFSWMPNNGSLNCLTCARPVATPTQTTTYTLTITDSYGCEKSESVTIVVKPTPNIVLNIGEESVCAGETTLITATQGFDNYKFYLNGITLVQAGSSNTLTTGIAGTYSVEVSDAEQCPAQSNTVSLSINENPEPTISLLGELNLCEGGNVSLQTTSDYAAYQWYINGQAAAGQTSPSIVLSNTAMVFVEVTDYNGCVGASASVFVNVSDNPEPTVLVGDIEFCQGESTTLAVLGNFANIQWFRNGAAISTAVDNTLTVTQSGNYTVAVTDLNNCSAVSSAIQIEVLPLPQVALTPVYTEICQNNNQPVTLTATFGYSQYNWYRNGNALVQTGTSNTYNAILNGTYVVEAINANGCSNTSNGVQVEIKEIPPVNIGATDTQICVGESSILFINSNASQITWSPATGLSCTTCANPIATPNATTTYTATIVSEEGCTASESITINVNSAAIPQISVSNPEICGNGGILLTATAGYNQYTWQNEQGVIVQQSSANTYTAYASGTYTVSVQTIGGCNAVSAPTEITIHSNPTVNISVSSEGNFCDGNVFTLTADAGFVNYVWYLNNTIVNGNNTNSILLQTSANVYVTVTDNNGCTASSPILVLSTNSTPTPEIVISSGDFCEGGSTLLSIPGNYSNYKWYKDGALIPTATTASLAVTEAGSYAVYVNNGAGCEGISNPVQIQTIGLPEVSITPANTELFICADSDELNLTATPGFDFYTWYRNGVTLVQAGPSNQLMVSIPGEYSVMVSNEQGCSAMSNSTSIYLYPNPPVNLYASDTHICAGESVQLSVNQDAVSYQWLPNNNTISCADCFNPVVTPLVSTDYYITIVDYNGCTSSDTVHIEVESAASIQITGNESLCIGQGSATLSATAGLNNYQWYFNGDAIYQATQATYTTNMAGDYQVEAQVGECIILSQVFTVNDLALPSPEISISGYNFCENNNSITLDAGNGYDTYEWINADTEAVLGTTQTLTITQDGNYYVSVSKNTCLGTSTVISIESSNFENPLIYTENNNACDGEPVSLIVPGVYSSVTWYNAANPSQALNEYTTNVYETMLPGNYYAEVTAQDGCSGTTPIVEVNIHTIPTTTITPELSYLCEGSTVTLQPTSLEGITAFQWYHNGFEIPNATQPQLITDLTGTFALEVINTITGCSSMTDAVEVIPAQVQALACDIPAMACMNEEVPLFLLGNPANPQSITWNFDNATIVSSQNNTQFVLQWETFGLKTISYTYTLANGCLQSGSCTILITEPPVEVDPIVENATDCQDNGSIILSVTNKDAISVSWSGPNGFTSNETSIYNLAPGTYVAHISYNGACPLDDIVVVIENESVAPNPIALDDYATLTNGETTYINVLQNDLGENIQLSGIIQYPNVGTAQIVSNTTISYIAPLGFTGQVELQYTITSLCETSATATVYITVTSAVNANNDLAILCDGNSIAINVLANDEGEGIYVSSISGNTDFGSIIIDENFNLIYVPNGNFNGSDEFTYNVSDPYGNTDQAIVNILCNEVNSPPLTDTIEVCTQPVTPVVFCFDLEDPDGDNVMITEGHTTYHCSLVILNDSCVRYTPLPGLTGIDTVFLEVCDTHIPTACNEVVAIVNIGCSQPDAVDDYMYFTCNETSNTINVLDNDMLNYVCDEEYNMTIVSGPLHGSASNLGGGLFSYTPQQDYSGTDEIEYVLCNSCGKCDTAFVHINIPTCGGSCNDGFETICVAPQQNINICPQFCTLNNDPTAFISSAITDIPCYLDLDDMCINYQSQAGFEGIQQIKVTACNTSGYCETVFINITVSYDCISTPIDAIKDYYTTYQSTSIQFNPLINDSGSPFNVSNYGQPLHGTLNTYNGVWDYTPANGFTGVDTLYYTICNAQGNCDTAPVCIEVLPTCSQYTFTCAEPGTMVSICPEFCNLPDNAQISNIQTLFLCSIDYTGGNCFTYQPMPYYSYGQKDTLKVTACAGTQCETAYIVLQIGCAVQVYDDYLTTTPEATITIDATENDIVPCDGAPIISIIENGLHGIASIDEDGLIVYQPANDGYLGNDIITYQSCSACDDTMCDTGYIIFTIADTDAIAQNDASQTYINSSVSIDVMENDVQPGNNPLEMFTWSQPQNGTVAWVNGIFIYTPNDNFLGTDTFEYQVCADAACATAQVNIEVVDNILAMNDIYTIPANTAATLNVLDNDYGNSVQITTVSANANANISIDSDNTSITIIPNANFEGVLSFEYTICSNNICDEATVNVLVNNNTAAPVALNDAYVTYVNEAINLDILANDINVDEFTTLTIIENTNHGQIEILENNQLLYTPNQNYIGNDVMLYQICDFNDNCHLAYVNITVLPTGNLAALNDWVTTPQNTAVTVSVSQNDINVADNATITIATAPQNGIAVVNQDGSIFYQPDADFAGIDNLIYEICNGSDCVQASLSIEVIASEAITAADDTAETSMNTNVNIDVLANDNYPVENFTLIISSIPQNGTAIVNADGSVDYLPNTGFVGEDTFSYELCSGGECVTAEVTVTVLSIEAKPVAQNDFVTTNVNTEINIFVLQNDTDPDNLSLSITEVSNAEHGTVNINAGHTITYMPDADFVGSDYFEYTICNTNNECAIATVFVEVVDCKISIPNGFSPNGDSTNDRFEVANVDCISDATLQVFNRWGDEVFYTEDVNARTWDGTWQKNNEPLPVGTYFYILSGNLNGNPVKYTGYIMLRR